MLLRADSIITAAPGGQAVMRRAAGRLAGGLGLSAGLAHLESRVLLAFANGLSVEALLARNDAPLETKTLRRFAALVRRRLQHEPIAYITGVREFYGLPLCASAAALIPRPETEIIADEALRFIPPARAALVLDMCAGGGALSLAIAYHRRRAFVIGADVSPAAIALAQTNARKLRITNARFVVGDFFAGVNPAAKFDLIVANPPYIKSGDAHLTRGDAAFEPRLALDGGDDGLFAIGKIAAAARGYLAAGGALIMEHGKGQSRPVISRLRAGGFVKTRILRDLAGVCRAVFAS